MNKKALQDAYSIFKTGGYKGDINEFFNLIKTNDRARNDAFNLFSSKGYNKDIDSFSSLIGLDKTYAANGYYVNDNYKENDKGKRTYFSESTGKYDREEVGYEYDRSKGVRFKGDSYGRYLDDFAYTFIKPALDITIDSIESGQSGDYTDAMNEMLINGKKGMTKEMAAQTIELMRKQQEKGPSENIAKWAKEMDAEDNKVFGFMKATWNNPAAAYEAIISSMAGQLKATKDGELLSLAIAAGGTTAAAGSTIAPGVGTVAGFLRGFMSTMGGGVESASKFGELLVEEFDGKMPTEEELINFLGNKEKFTKFRNKALAKGGTIALVDNIGGALVQNSVFKTAKTGRKVLAATKGLVGEAIVGGGGEALSSTVIGEEVSAVDVGLEILGQGGQATVDVGSALITPGKYSIKGDKVTLQQVNEILNTATPEEIANIDIEIKNDPALQAEYNKKKQKGYLQTQVDPAVSDPNDRSRAADLQQEKQSLEAKIKKGGIFKGVNTETKLENVNKEIDAILNKYSPEVGPEVDPAGVEARTVVKDEAYESRLQLLKDEITKGVKQTKFYRKGNISVEEDNADNVTEMFVKQEADNLGYDLTLLNNELSETTDAKRKNQITKKIAEVEAEIQALDENSKEAKNAHGFLLEDHATGKMTIVINTSKDISSAGNINVAAHELLHAVLRNTFLTETGLRARELKGTGLQTGQKLLDYLVANEETQLLLPGGILDRLKSYAEINEKGEAEYGDTAGQEVLNLLSDAFININYKAENETWYQGLGSRISDILQAYLPERFANKLNFGDGKQVFDFIKTFNKAVAGDVVAGRIIERVSRRGVDVDQRPTEEAAKTPLSKEASDRVQRIYEEKGEAGAMEIIQEFKPITNKLVQRRSEAPNFDRQLLTDEIETGQRGIFDLIREYKPESGVPLAAYINKFLPARAIEASQRVLGEEFTEDVTEKVDIAAEEVVEPTVTTKPKPKKIVLADRLKIADKVENAIDKIIPGLDIENLTFKNLKNKIPVITGKLFGISPKKIVSGANITKGELQKSQMFINKNADLLISMLPEGSTQGGMATGVPNTLLKAFYTKTDRAKMAKTGSKAGLAIQQKNKISKEEFLEVFGIVDGKPNRTDRNTSARVLALANTLGKMITNQAVRQQVKAEGLRALEDGKSSTMFSLDKNKELVNKYPGIPYYNTLDNAGAETYVVDLVDKIIPIFKPGFLNATVAITTSTMPDRLVKDAKSMLANYMGLKGVEFGVNNDFARTKFDKALINKKSNKELQALNKRNVDNFEYMWLAIYDAVQKDNTIVTPLLHWLSGSTNEGTHPQRIGAELTHIDRTATGKLEFEHALPNSEAYRLLMDAVLSQSKVEFIKTLEALQKNYKLIAMSKEDSNKLTAAGYQRAMPEGWNIFDNNWWERYFNKNVLAQGGINPENFTSIASGENLANELNVNIKGEQLIIKTNLTSNKVLSEAVNKARTTPFSKEAKGITVLDFDDTLATTKSLVGFTRPDGTTGTLNAEQYASTYEDLLDQGYTFDFSDFNKVVKGKLAPLFQKALKLQKKFGPKNMFVLTARPPAAQKAIFDFLKANGLNIPLKNITGLGNSTSEAKALWIADKVGEGFNDFYFADDALQNVQAVDNMLEQFDVKRKVQQAKVQFSKDINTDFNNILEEVTGIEAKKRFSDIKARKRGASKGKFRFFIPPSHEDFVGLLYNFMGKGRKGDQHRNFFEQALVRPLNRAYREIDTAKQAIANDYKELNKQFPKVKSKLRKKTPDGDFIFEDALRVYLWNKHNYDIPGLSPTDQTKLSELIMNDPELQAYAETLNVVSKQDTYVDPGQGWEGGNIKTDLIDATGRVGRAEYFTEFNENADVLFSPENLNKIEAAYGADFRSALEDMLHRISTGVNRPKGQSGTVNAFMNYLNGSVGTVMFFNVRSAILQQMSIVNYINFADNNIFAAAKAFANQVQYWKDFAFIFNSDMLKQRRGGIGTDINGNDLAQAVAGSKEPTKVVISKLLQLGFLPTQIGDNIAIATGGATFYRNRINKYIKDGLSKKEAETKAFTDFQDLTQSTQQSSRPDMTSKQQASWIGKLVLNFQNITSQYNRIIKKAALDIGKGRISPPYTTRTQSNLGNLSKILYYGAIQNVIFYSLQTALFAVMFDDDQDEDQVLKKSERVIQGSIDSILRGAGIYGAVASTLKNMIIKFKEQREKGYNKDESAVPMELLNFSPVVGIKIRQLVNAEKTLNYNENIISEMETFEADNPQWSAVTNYTQALTNFPANRLYQKSINMRNALDKDYTNFQRVLFFSGYTTWSLGLGDNERVIEAKEKVKINKENARKEKRVQKKIEKIAANKSIIEENKKKKDGRCAHVNTSGSRCKNKAIKDGLCSIHEKVEKRTDGKQLQCRKRKSDGTRCKMMTTNKSQYCYYHD